MSTSFLPDVIDNNGLVVVSSSHCFWKKMEHGREVTFFRINYITVTQCIPRSGNLGT